MSLKDAINHIPVLGKEVSEMLKVLKEKFTEKAEQAFKDAKLADGNIISYDGDMPVVGMPVFVLDEAGQRIPAPDGELPAMEDGTILVIKGGAVAEVKPGTASNPDEQMADTTANPTTAEQNTAEVKRLIESIVKETVFSKEEVTALFATSKGDIDSVIAENLSLKEELNKTKELLKETFNLVEKIGEQSSAPVEKKKDGFVKEQKEVNRDVKAFREKYLNK